MKNYYIQTFGCQMNVYDSELVESILKDSGYYQAGSLEEADIMIFNTCSVRQHAVDRVIGKITSLGPLKKRKPSLVIGVIGCAAQDLKQGFKDRVKIIDFIAGTDQYQKIPEIISKSISEREFQVFTEPDYLTTYEGILPKKEKGISAFISIMRGCNNFCTYCIVPYLRGRERSRSPMMIADEIRKLEDSDYQDITLLGQNVNSYKYEDYDFVGLLEYILKHTSIPRIRFVTSHPKDMSFKLIDLIASDSRMCNHVHLPMQAGNNRILQLMNRGYTIEDYLKKVEYIRARLPYSSVTSDIICGFPTETDSEYRDTLSAMKTADFDYAFTFKYSPREGTKAAEMTDNIPDQEKQARLEEMIKLQEELTEKNYRKHIGERHKVLVEMPSKRDEKQMSGRISNNKICVFDGDDSLIGKYVDVDIVDAVGWTLKGRMVK